MTIICPSCDASYRLGADALGAGRLVRCARCKSEWFAGGAAEPSVVEPLTSLEPNSLEPIESLDDAIPIDAVESSNPLVLADAPAPAYQPARRASTARSWFARAAGKDGKARSAPERLRKKSAFRVRPVAVVAAFGCVALATLVGERVAVVRAAPSLASLYDTIGLPVNVRGLSIGEVRSVERIEEGVPLLLVSGVVRNVSGDVVEVPRLKLAITADRTRELYVWTTVAARAKLAPGESAPFRARLASPPAEGQGLAVRFVAQADLARPGH